MRLPGFSPKLKPADPAGPKSAKINLADRHAVIGHRALGKYEILQMIGEGSNGEVYLARVVANPAEYVVVKRVKAQLLSNPRFMQFFDAEIASMKRFDHPYAVKFYEASLHDPMGPCLVMEYVHGVTLEAVLHHYRRLPADHVGRLLGQFCHALQAAHDAGIMHRDLKPANVMVVGFGTPDEHLKVMDFGFAGFTEKPHIQLAELTGRGPTFACGTPAYVSPEMIRADTVDARADIYSVGVMLYELLTGDIPFNRETVDEILAAHVEERPPRFKAHGVTDVSAAVEGVVGLALAKFPNERQQTPRDLAKHYGHAIGRDVWAETAPPGQQDSGRNRRAAAESSMAICTPAPGTAAAKFTLSDTFEALLPPRLASAKLKGLVEDYAGVVIESEPGVIRMRFGLPDGYKEPGERSGLFRVLAAISKPGVKSGNEPIEVALQMKKVDPNRVAVVVSFHPLKEFPPADAVVWRSRCEQLNSVLRMYLMASA